MEALGYPEGPPEFSSHSWPHPRLLDNKAQGQDECLVWFMDHYRDHIRDMNPRSKNR